MLHGLLCHDNKIEEIKSNPALERLWCQRNMLAQLDLSDCPNIYRAYCSENPYLTEIWLKQGQTIHTFWYDKDIATIRYRE